jgi:4-hydroxy-tetrahydrodipicolinate synthase
MKPLTSAEITGTWGTLLLPINSDESIDFSRLAHEIECLLEARLDGIYSNGTAGEFDAQTEDEFDEIHTLLAERCERARVPFQIGVSHTSAQVSLSRLKRAVQLGPCAVQVILPDWYPVSDGEAVAYLARMADAAGPVGLVLYNPPHAKRVLEPSAIGMLRSAIPSLVGVKVVDGDAGWYAAMKKHAPGLSVFVPGHRLASGYELGASGSYSNVACLQPVGAKRWQEVIKKDISQAKQLERKIQRFVFEQIPADYPNAAKDKLLAAVGGWCEIGTRLRWPYRWYANSEVARLQPIARALLPELFS